MSREMPSAAKLIVTELGRGFLGLKFITIDNDMQRIVYLIRVDIFHYLRVSSFCPFLTFSISSSMNWRGSSGFS